MLQALTPEQWKFISDHIVPHDLVTLVAFGTGLWRVGKAVKNLPDIVAEKAAAKVEAHYMEHEKLDTQRFADVARQQDSMKGRMDDLDRHIEDVSKSMVENKETLIKKLNAQDSDLADIKARLPISL